MKIYPMCQLFILARLEVVELPSSVALKDIILRLVSIYAAIVEVEPLNFIVCLLH